MERKAWVEFTSSFFSSHVQCSNFHDSFAEQMLLNVMVTFAVKSLGPDMGTEEY